LQRKVARALIRKKQRRSPEGQEKGRRGSSTFSGLEGITEKYTISEEEGETENPPESMPE